ncbi:MAG TPA: PLDc N-terminal domain-containing protein [Phycisphaerales bacterium]|nr:PLDc N-terminal domain-containing protein [Phycisphaerales bacterium]
MPIQLLAELYYGGYGILGLIVLILDIIAIISVLAGSGSVGHKLLWSLLIILLPFIGMILYFLIGRSAADA